MKSLNLTLISFFLPLLMLENAFAAENIHIQHAWIREAPPTIKVMAGYLEIENSSDRAICIISAESDAFERIEFHLSQVKEGVARMQQQDHIIIPAKSTFSFKPESFHLMLFNNSTPMREGNSVTIKLTFDNDETHTFDTIVKRSDSTETHEHHH